MKYSKLISAVVLLIGFVGTQGYPTNCKGVTEEQIVLLPNPGNCSTYIECAFEQPVVMPCPEGLEWNDAAKQCDFPEIAQCKESYKINKIYTTCDGVPSSIDVLLPNPSDCGSYIQCVHGKPLVRPCPSGLHWSVAANRCEWPELANCKRNSCEGVPETVDVLLPNPEDCGTYIQCVHQKPVIRPCPGGLHWSVEANRCEWPNIAKCNINSNVINPKKNWTSCEGVPEDEIVLLPTPGNCSTYIECTYEKPVVMLCPEGLQWNDAAKQCDYPEIAKCEEKTSFVPKKNWTSCEGVPENEIVLLPTPGNCSTYIECTYEKPVVMLCPEGLQWNDAAKQCDYPEIAKCEEKTSFVPKKNWTSCEGVPENEIVLLPTPGNCSTYIECTYEKPVVMLCPEGLQWNGAAKQCDYPEIAKCEEKTSFVPKKNWTSCEGVPENEIVLLPTPGNCSTYIECTYEKPVVMPCPEGLQWNDAAKQCDYPEIAKCEEKTSFIPKKNWTSCEGVPENEIVLLPTPGNCSTYIECTYEKPVIMSCPEGLHWNDAAKLCDYPENAKCEEKKQDQPQKQYTSCEGVPSSIDVLLPNPSDCGSYIQCVHGKPLVRPCPSGLHWSVAANRCEWPEIANCKRNSCEGVPETVDVLLPNPEDCGTYIQCVHQKPVVRPCPGGLHWSIAANRCEWPNIANCQTQTNP